ISGLVSKIKTLFILTIFTLSVGLKYVEGQSRYSLHIEVQFNHFIKRFQKPYVNGTAIYRERLLVFEENVKRQEKLNSLRTHNASAFYGVTKFSDLTPEEFRAKFLKYRPTSYAPPFSKSGTRLEFMSLKEGAVPRKDIPQKFDWRDYKNVTPVKNQKDCGGCWAFSTVETIETMHSIKYGKLKELSVQQMIDCAGNGNYGCRGGDICSALAWLIQSKTSLVTEEKYPLTDESNSCKIFPNGTKGVEIKSYTCKSYVDQETEMLSLIVNHGPLDVSVDATTWSDYQGGVIMYHCPDHNNHAAVIVGYDLTGDVPYYIVRNSWGEDFGDKGYIKIKYTGNLCGIAEHVATVTL
ncbi:cathepsin O-like, partial [Lineus longissimus]|uniref:cathepsin O-like n=1 Tax=Lineus longissimus TaxID=88925 RepID=UPI00315C6E0B